MAAKLSIQSNIEISFQNGIQRKIDQAIIKNNERLNELATTLFRKHIKSKILKIFDKNFFRSKGSQVSFHRKRLNSPYLFYIKIKFASCMNLKISHIYSNKMYTIRLYPQDAPCDSEEYNGKIYICGGYYASSLKCCISINVSNLDKSKPFTISELIYSRHDHILISTANGLIVAGGSNGLTPIVKCEYLQSEREWKEIPSFNQTYFSMQGIFIYPDSVYLFGSQTNLLMYEKLNIQSFTKWHLAKLNIYELNVKVVLLISASSSTEILVFNEINYKTLELFKFNFSNLSLKKLSSTDPITGSCKNKPIIHQSTIQFISANPFHGSNKISLDLNSFTWNDEELMKF